MAKIQDDPTSPFFMTVFLFGTLVIVATGAWAYFAHVDPVEPATIVAIKETAGEGQAKAQMIERLTGLQFAPEIAKHATVTFSGTTVQIETHAINVWEGRHAGWKEVKK